MTLLFLFACTGASPSGDCLDNGDCVEGQACIDQTCEDVDCLTSADCPIAHVCHPKQYVCVAGCADDDDCLSGQTCNAETHECVDAACRTTELDCHVGDVCDPVSGQCVEPDNPVCATDCHIYDRPSCPGGGTCIQSISGVECKNDNECDAGETCDLFLASDDFCYTNSECPEGSVCSNFQCVVGYCHQDYCYYGCDAQDDTSCAAGFQCVDFGAGYGELCYGDCGYYVSNGYL
jgi:hypothetical protein